MLLRSLDGRFEGSSEAAVLGRAAAAADVALLLGVRRRFEYEGPG